MPESTATRLVSLKAFAASHPGLQRDHNEDRCHADVERGIFMVIDGVGGHAAGDRAAEIAYAMLRARLERETGTLAERVREAITLANNEIYQASQRDARLTGMACVLTVAIVRDGSVTVGHVGDTRLYEIRAGSVRKLTSDHSPVGEREDRGELSEAEAMRHPRRNEIYRDVGSEPHSPADERFIDILEFAFEPDSALLLCTDGLTDLVSSAHIGVSVSRHAGDPRQVVTQLLADAIEAGGKDNVSAVYIEGERFAATARATAANAKAGRLLQTIAGAWRSALASRAVALAAGCVVGAALVVGALTWTRQAPLSLRNLLPAGTWPRTWTVSQDGMRDFRSIREALARARAGDTIRVEPGEYAEHLVLTGAVSLVSAQPRAAIIVPAADAGARPTAVEMHAGGARISGFRIAGDQARPLGVGLRFRRANGEADNVEISGARLAAIEIEGPSEPVVRASYVHDNPGIGVLITAPAAPRLLQNVIADNGRAAEAPRPAVETQEGARPTFFGNIIINNGLDVVRGLNPALHEQITRDNIVGRPVAPAPAKPPARKGRQ